MPQGDFQKDIDTLKAEAREMRSDIEGVQLGLAITVGLVVLAGLLIAGGFIGAALMAGLL
ncbi:hypothetical protein [Euryhalocaulis caribicus]|uniref:hypothetical protein n=1 Tax=Euryhalocaulis caribicus TaxID=1161401 RepID=UPI0003A8DB40|nr:hypothetical protein [Euryhalocaulis caribicus]